MTTGIVWTVGKRTFRSSIPREREQFEFLVMYAPLDWRERDAYEMYVGLCEVRSELPMSVPAIAAVLERDEAVVRERIERAIRKVARYLRYNGLPIQYGEHGSSREAMERLRTARAALGALG